MTNEFINRTDYFNRKWTWLKTIGIIAFFTLLLFSWESMDEGSEYSWLRYLIYVILVFAFATAPIDDLAVDKNHFYYFRTSIIPILSEVTKYEIIKIKSIRAGGRHTEGSDILQFLTMNGGGRNTIEITLVDDTYRSLDVAIYKKDMQVIISKVKEQMILV
jgi:hypothetical protein